jgi:hypothetical protein
MLDLWLAADDIDLYSGLELRPLLSDPPAGPTGPCFEG